jgi:hypothetical protein
MIKKIEHTLRKYSCLKEVTGCWSLCPEGGFLRAASSACGSCPAWRLELIAAHFNWPARRCIDEDEAFCRRLAEQAGLVFVTQKLAATGIPAGQSPETNCDGKGLLSGRTARITEPIKLRFGHPPGRSGGDIFAEHDPRSGLERPQGVFAHSGQPVHSPAHRGVPG